MPNDKNLNQLVINEIESGEIFEKMKENNLLNDDELYLVKEEEGEELVLGDMMAAVYDPQKKQQDIFKYVDDAIANIEPGSGGGSGGIDIPASDTAPAEGNYWLDTSEDGKEYTRVESFNGRTGAVTPQNGDYTAEMVGAEKKSLVVNFHMNDDEEVIADKTFSEVWDAINSGVRVRGEYAIYAEDQLVAALDFVMTQASENGIVFGSSQTTTSATISMLPNGSISFFDIELLEGGHNTDSKAHADIREAIEAASDFVVTFTSSDEGETYIANKTNVEITAAVEAGKNVVGKEVWITDKGNAVSYSIAVSPVEEFYAFMFNNVNSMILLYVLPDKKVGRIILPLVTEETVDAKIEDAIGSAIGGSY